MGLSWKLSLSTHGATSTVPRRRLGMTDKDHRQEPKQENRAQGQELHSQLHLVSQEKLKNIWRGAERR